jgi:hypothetical protein
MNFFVFWVKSSAINLSPLKILYKLFFTRSLMKLRTVLMKSEETILYNDKAVTFPLGGIWTVSFSAP